MTNPSSPVRRALTLAVLLAAVVASLGSAAHPSLDSAAKADVDRRIAAMQLSGRAVPAPTAAEPMPLAVGQWVTHKTIDQDNQPSIVTTKIVGQQDGAWWLETSIDSYYGHNAVKMLIAMGDRKDPKTFDLRQIFTKDKNGRVTEIPASMISMMRGNWQSMMDQMALSWERLPQEDVNVLGGRFVGCYKTRSSVSYGGNTYTSDGWFHPAVPVNGMVKSVGVDRPSTMELVDFGLEGAVSEF